MVKHYRITVKGKVQGVWFRKYTREAAISRNLSGLVKNERNGTVYIESEGNKNDLQSFVQWLYKGSPLSKVEEVYWEEGACKNFSGFVIIR